MPDNVGAALPNFDNPPVVETVLSVQFEKLEQIRSVHFGLFWERVRSRFPKTEEKLPLEPVLEQFDKPVASNVQMKFGTMEALPLPRSWLLNDDGTEMMQLQNNYFIKNWRQTGDNPYPRYKNVIKPAFDSDYGEFKKFITKEKLGKIKVTQCEVTYVNHIVAGKGWNTWDEIEKIFTFWKQPPAEPYPGRTEDFGFFARFLIPGKDGKPVGRLRIDVQPALKAPDNKLMYVMTSTARGICGKDIEFLDIGREWIVKSFEALTTPHMHKIWKRVRNNGTCE